MNYRSPIDIIQSEIQTAIENEIYKAVVNVGINVDKVELLKALTYDRNQYTRGYYDRDSEIVRCKDCRRKGTYECPIHAGAFSWFVLPDEWFCAGGERREKND